MTVDHREAKIRGLAMGAALDEATYELGSVVMWQWPNDPLGDWQGIRLRLEPRFKEHRRTAAIHLEQQIRDHLRAAGA
jgi:hypothetical protein